MFFLRGIRYVLIPFTRSMQHYKGVLVALLYMLTSVVLILFNKVALSVYDFPYIHVLTLLQVIDLALSLIESQALCSLSLMLGFKKLGLISFQDFSSKNFWATMPLGVSFVAYMILGMFAIQVVNM